MFFFVWVLFWLHLKSWKIQTASVPGYSFSCLEATPRAWLPSPMPSMSAPVTPVATPLATPLATPAATPPMPGPGQVSNFFRASRVGWEKNRASFFSERRKATFLFFHMHISVFGCRFDSRFGSANLEVIRFFAAKELYGKLFPSVRVAMEIWYTQNTLIHWWTSEWAFVEISEFLDSLLLMNFLGWTLFWQFLFGSCWKVMCWQLCWYAICCTGWSHCFTVAFTTALTDSKSLEGPMYLVWKQVKNICHKHCTRNEYSENDEESLHRSRVCLAIR